MRRPLQQFIEKNCHLISLLHPLTSLYLDSPGLITMKRGVVAIRTKQTETSLSLRQHINRAP